MAPTKDSGRKARLQRASALGITKDAFQIPEGTTGPWFPRVQDSTLKIYTDQLELWKE
jgi:hypothetical protein